MIDFPIDAVKTTALAEHSRFVQRVRRRYPDELVAFAAAHPGLPRTDSINQLIDHLLAHGRDLPDGVYHLRCAWLRNGQPFTTTAFTNLHKVTPVAAPQGYERMDERRRERKARLPEHGGSLSAPLHGGTGLQPCRDLPLAHLPHRLDQPLFARQFAEDLRLAAGEIEEVEGDAVAAVLG